LDKYGNMALSGQQKDIFRTAELNGNLSIAELARLSSQRTHSVQYHISMAIERGWLKKHAFLNLSLLGYQQYEIYFSLAPEQKNTRDDLLRYLTNSSRISWLGELGGDFQYGMNICVASIEELLQFLNELSGTFGAIISDKYMAVRLSLHYFGNKYLSSKNGLCKELSYQNSSKTVLTDETDHKILQYLSCHAGDSRRVMAQKLSLPQSTLDYRIRKMEKDGIIQGYYYLFAERLTGTESFLLLLSGRGFDEQVKSKLYQYAKKHPNITVLINCLGSWDHELVVEVENRCEIILVTEEIRDSFGTQLSSIRILPLFRYAKVVEYPM
jgi:DNA-binding Lrp family transcriptional regulator